MSDNPKDLCHQLAQSSGGPKDLCHQLAQSSGGPKDLCHQLAQLSDNPKDLCHQLAQGRAALPYSGTGSATLRWKTSPSSRVDIVPP